MLSIFYFSNKNKFKKFQNWKFQQQQKKIAFFFFFFFLTTAAAAAAVVVVVVVYRPLTLPSECALGTRTVAWRSRVLRLIWARHSTHPLPAHLKQLFAIGEFSYFVLIVGDAERGAPPLVHLHCIQHIVGWRCHHAVPCHAQSHEGWTSYGVNITVRSSSVLWFPLFVQLSRHPPPLRGCVPTTHTANHERVFATAYYRLFCHRAAALWTANERCKGNTTINSFVGAYVRMWTLCQHWIETYHAQRRLVLLFLNCLLNVVSLFCWCAVLVCWCGVRCARLE